MIEELDIEIEEINLIQNKNLEITQKQEKTIQTRKYLRKKF